MTDATLHQQALGGRWKGYQFYRESGQLYAALVCLAEIESSIVDERTAAAVQKRWRKKVDAVELSRRDVEALRPEANGMAAQIQGMVSGRGTPDLTNLVPALALRVQIDAVSACLGRRGFELGCDAQLRTIDEALTRIKVEHGDLFERAQRQLAEAWGIPMKSRFLGDGSANAGSSDP